MNWDFVTISTNQKRCTDITYIFTGECGWTYLASVEDMLSRRIIGWAYGKNIDAEFAKKPLRMSAVGLSKSKE